MSKMYRGLGQAVDRDLLERASQILIQGKRKPGKALLRDCIATATVRINLELSAQIFCL